MTDRDAEGERQGQGSEDEPAPGFRVVSGYVRVGSGGLGGRGRTDASGGEPIPPGVQQAMERRQSTIQARLRCQLCGIVKERIEAHRVLDERRAHEKAAHPDMDARRIQLQQELFDMERALWGVGVEYIEDDEEQAP